MTASRIVWHRPLLALATAMAALAVVAAVGSVIDPRQITGVPLWNKPLLFAVSVGLYAVTLAWLLGLLTRHRRLAHQVGTIAAGGLAIEMIIIVGVALAGTTSHFNVSTPLATALWGIMAVSIVVVWMLGVPLAIMLFRTDLGDPARALAIRAGLIIALAGMGLAFLMTGPQGDQITNYSGIVGAHTVGPPDGGAGLPLVGWSTVGGDLRIPHFVGMHALQLVPLTALLLELLARRVPALRDAGTRFGIVWVVVALYVALLGLVTAQALAGESILHPDPVVVAVVTAVVAAAVLVIVGVIVRRRPYTKTAQCQPLPSAESAP
ncbi:hypothetical protein [Subtercola sp. YIM 133946]|uniref:hypothetical protein n=1 Tax=Subtercola sp. YIM 133946 TaxID=3118909 RepID=UPI002F92924E